MPAPRSPCCRICFQDSCGAQADGAAGQDASTRARENEAAWPVVAAAKARLHGAHRRVDRRTFVCDLPGRSLRFFRADLESHRPGEAEAAVSRTSNPRHRSRVWAVGGLGTRTMAAAKQGGSRIAARLTVAMSADQR